MAGGFTLVDRDISVGSILREFIGKASTQFVGGEALENPGGYLQRCSAQDDKVFGIFNVMITHKSMARPATINKTTTLGEKLSYIPALNSELVFRTALTGGDAPPINGVAANVNTDLSTVLVTAAGSTNDYTGGTIFVNGEQTTITADVVSGGIHTFTTGKPLARAATTGDLVYIVPFSRGFRGVKLSSVSVSAGLGVSPAVADKTGGYCEIVRVGLENRFGVDPFVDVKFYG